MTRWLSQPKGTPRAAIVVSVASLERELTKSNWRITACVRDSQGLALGLHYDSSQELVRLKALMRQHPILRIFQSFLEELPFVFLSSAAN